MTIKEALLLAKSRISHVSDIPQKESAILLSFATGLTQSELITKDLLEFDEEHFFGLIDRRANYEPIEYITGRANFYSLSFDVSNDCLIPRPETELLIDMVKEECAKTRFKRVADVCTGSGAIAITLAHEIPELNIFASDISTNALNIAKQNAKKHLLQERVCFLEGDLLEPLPSCDIIVSNPPYIADNYDLPESVKYEPKIALFSGTDGADLIKKLIVQFDAHDAKVLFCEFGYDQRDIVQNFCKNFTFFSLEFYKDFAGLTRGFVIRKIGD